MVVQKLYPFSVGDSIDIAAIVVFLASDESRMLTGTTIAADGAGLLIFGFMRGGVMRRRSGRASGKLTEPFGETEIGKWAGLQLSF